MPAQGSLHKAIVYVFCFNCNVFLFLFITLFYCIVLFRGLSNILKVINIFCLNFPTNTGRRRQFD